MQVRQQQNRKKGLYSVLKTGQKKPILQYKKSLVYMCVCVCVFPLVWATNSSRKDSQYLPLALTLSPREIPVFKRKQFSQPTSRVLRVSMSSRENGATEVEWGPNSRGHSSHTTNPKNKSSLINAPPEQHKKDGGRN